MMKKTLIWSLMLVGFALFSFTSAAVAEEYAQTPIMLKANDVLPQNIIKGDNYKVADKVINDGLINTYELNTDYGTIAAEGTAELMIRIHELKALKVMEEVDRTGVFGDAVVSGVKAPFKGAVALVTSPIDTTKNVAKGTGQFLSNVGRSFVSDDPDQDNPIKVALGYDVAKRQFAYEFGINPYSSNEPVMERLGQIARSAVAGGIAPKAAMAAVDTDLVTGMRIAGAVKGMKELVRDNPPGKLGKINKSKLEQMGISSALAQAFQDNYSYDPQEKTLLVGELETMKGVKGRDLFIAKADLASEKSVALYNRLTARMMANYHAKVTPVEAIQQSSGVLYLKNRKGITVLLAPVDYAFWTKRLADKLNKFDADVNKMSSSKGKELWVTGNLDRTTRSQFEAKDWKITENADKVLLK